MERIFLINSVTKRAATNYYLRNDDVDLLVQHYVCVLIYMIAFSPLCPTRSSEISFSRISKPKSAERSDGRKASVAKTETQIQRARDRGNKDERNGTHALQKPKNYVQSCEEIRS